MKNLVYMRGQDAVIEVWDYVAGCKRDCWIDAADVEVISRFKSTWSANPARKSSSKWYVLGKEYDAGTRKRKTIMFHRLLLGVTDPTVEVHHKDNDGLNNRRGNLQLVDHKTNMRERSPDKDWEQYDAKQQLRRERSARNAILRTVRAQTGYSRQYIWAVYTGRMHAPGLLATLTAALAGAVAPTPTNHARDATSGR